MGMLLDGAWVADDEVARTDPDGRWQRSPSHFRNWIERGEPGRYHLYAAWNCPWAHRALLARAYKQLEDLIPVSFVAPRRTEQGWVFAPADGYTDAQFNATALHQIYTRSDPGYSGRVTVPLLWDRKTGTAISNESADIVRMFNSCFTGLAPDTPNLYPKHLHQKIDMWNDRIHANLNNGVYRTGFSSTQEAYDEAVAVVFETLDAIETQLAETPYLTGETFTEADLRLFPTLVRFDVGYFTAFKCSRNRLIDFDNLWAYARRLYAMPGFAETVKFDIYRRGYNSPSEKRNPLGIVPIAPAADWRQPIPT